MKNYHPGRVQSKITDGIREVEVVQRTDGKNALAVDSRTTIDQVFGRDPLPDSYFSILNTGVAGNTWTLDIAATSKDPTSPDRDIPAYQKIFTVQAGEVGDEIALRNRIISELSADSTFEDTCFLKAQAPVGDLRAIVHITSTEFSLSGEFVERPNAGDFDVNVTGSADVDIAFDNLIARGKPTSLARDPNNPHRIGILGISGSVVTTPGAVGDLIEDYLSNATYGSDMTQDGSVTPVVYQYLADVTGTYDYFIQSISVHGQDNGIKYRQFLAVATLSTGITTSIVSDGQTQTRPTINDTEDLKHEWVRGLVGNYSLEFAPGTDDVVATAVFDPPFPLRAGSSDKIEMTVNDNLTAVSSLDVLVNGFKKEV
jgi:hypothetical protein